MVIGGEIYWTACCIKSFPVNELAEVVEAIGRLNDVAEKDKWAVAEQVAIAYAEFGLYERGLTEGLVTRTKKSADTIRNYCRAEELRVRLRVDHPLSVSHFITLAYAVSKYNLSDDAVRDWIDVAVETPLSVDKLSAEIATASVLDARAHFMRKVSRFVKLATTLYQDAAGVGIPVEAYQALKTLVSMVGDFEAEIEKWKAPD